MVFRPSGIQVVWQKLLLDFAEQPVASSEPTNENDMLECKFKKRIRRRGKMSTHTYRFVSHLALVQQSLNNALKGSLKERGHIRPQEFELSESDIATWVVIPCSAKFDIVGFAGILKPKLRDFIEAADNMVEVCQECRIFQVI